MQVVALREQAAAKRAMDIFDVTDDPEPYIPYSELWPARRRAQRLSFAVWPAICEQNGDLQRVLDEHKRNKSYVPEKVAHPVLHVSMYTFPYALEIYLSQYALKKSVRVGARYTLTSV